MTIREAIQTITHSYNQGVPGDDSRLRPRRVYSALLDARARVLSRQRNLRNLNDNNYTTLPCVPIEEITVNDCPCVPVAGCKNYKTSCDLPIPLGEGDGLIQDVTTYDGSIKFSRIDFAQVGYLNDNRYTAGRPSYYIRNKRLYLLNVPSRLKIITIRLLAEDFSDVCSQCEGEDSVGCNPLDAVFNVDRKYMTDIIQTAVFHLFKTNSKQDVHNNGLDETNSGAPPQNG